jgi:outer membrane DcaP-like protein
MKTRTTNIVILFLLLVCVPAFSQDTTGVENKKKTVFKFGGFAKLDVMVTNFDDGEPEAESPIRDVHLPGSIPVGGSLNDFDTHMHVKESRFSLDVTSTVLEKPIHGLVEMDFLFSKAGDERVSNSYNPRLRHFYFEYGKFLFGQTWSTFMVVVLPEDLDFSGAGEGIVFNRQAQIRFTTGNWQFGLENPETTYTPYLGGSFNTSSGGIPDMILRRNFNSEKVSFSIAGIARNPRIFDAQGERHGTFGFGVTAGGKLNVGKKDDIRFVGTYGQGLGRYVAFGFSTAVVPDDKNELTTLNTYNGYLAYLHHWNDKWKSSVNGSYLMVDNDAELTGTEVNKSAFSMSVNLLYQPVPVLLVGGEVMYGYRELENEVNGDFTRLQLSAKYFFNYEN